MCYFAEFVEQPGKILWRLDTRVYLAENARPCRNKDQCIAAVVAKNPGSAVPINRDLVTPRRTGDLLEVKAGPLLRIVRKWFREAFALTGKPTDGAFVRVWNLFYLCDKDLKSAIERFERCSENSRWDCPSEGKWPQIVWYAWGGPHPRLDGMKMRFLNKSIACPFFYDHRAGAVIHGLPSTDDHARHTQGLPKARIIEFLAENLGKYRFARDRDP